MSIVTAYTPFTKLRPFKNSWRVQVKCLHSWKQHTSFGGKQDPCFLQTKSHAPVQRVLLIDKWGVVQNVSVTAAGGQYRTTQHKYRMTIADDAVFSGSDLADERHLLSLAKVVDLLIGLRSLCSVMSQVNLISLSLSPYSV
ncbi:hypothetical protein F2Q69_00036947 [Brassica cretica]|uniref:DUF223 domain-containing protein n=1 Tax=Brassica cretica TaxID=69181 RepID=A0A8S9SR28_BRACR|nr:hypothetical protein F2Q69_00036947 [Brassica cretica]